MENCCHLLVVVVRLRSLEVMSHSPQQPGNCGPSRRVQVSPADGVLRFKLPLDVLDWLVFGLLGQFLEGHSRDEEPIDHDRTVVELR